VNGGVENPPSHNPEEGGKRSNPKGDIMKKLKGYAIEHGPRKKKIKNGSGF